MYINTINILFYSKPQPNFTPNLSQTQPVALLTLKLSFSLSSILTVTAAASLKPSFSQSHPPSRPYSHSVAPPPCVSTSTSPSKPSQHPSLSDLSPLTVRSWEWNFLGLPSQRLPLWVRSPNFFFFWVNFLIFTWIFLLLGWVVLFLVW